MPYEAKAYLTTGQGGEKYAVSGTFDDQEWKALLEFVQYAKDLQAVQLVSQGGPGKLSLSYTAESGLSYLVDLPPGDQILALLHRLRPFVLNDEPTNYYQVCNHLTRRFDDNPFRHFLKSLREYYSGKRMQAIVLIQSNEGLINSEETLMKWLNAHEYHKDRDKPGPIGISASDITSGDISCNLCNDVVRQGAGDFRCRQPHQRYGRRTGSLQMHTRLVRAHNKSLHRSAPFSRAR